MSWMVIVSDISCVVTMSISSRWALLSSSGYYGFEPRLGQTWGAYLFYLGLTRAKNPFVCLQIIKADVKTWRIWIGDLVIQPLLTSAGWCFVYVWVNILAISALRVGWLRTRHIVVLIDYIQLTYMIICSSIMFVAHNSKCQAAALFVQ